MKLKTLTIKNVGLIADTVIQLDKPLLLFYGEIRQGKTTILNAVRWVFGGSFPSDIIRHGEKEASVELAFEGGMVSRSWYRAKDGSTKSRDVTFIRDGKPVQSPVSEIKRFLNPFLLDQDFLRNKSELERRQYFTELFAVDTKALDTEYFESDRKAVALRASIKGYGEIDLTPVERVDVSALNSQLATVRADYSTKKAALEAELDSLAKAHQSDVDTVNAFNGTVIKWNAEVDRAETEKQDIRDAIEAHKRKIAELEHKLAGMPVLEKKELRPMPAAPDRSAIQKKILDLTPDTAALEAQISNAAAQNVRAEQYEKNKARDSQRKAEEATLSNLERRLREIKAEKQAKLKSVSDSTGINGLAFDDEGNFVYEGATAGMLSTSQIMRLSSALSAKYPEGFGIELLDRGESLGRAIFEYVELAKEKKGTILATIVGSRPAAVPAEIGVFVVKDGVVMKDPKEGELL